MNVALFLFSLGVMLIALSVWARKLADKTALSTIHESPMGRVWELRARLSPAWSAETAQGGVSEGAPSMGQCAVTALVVRELLGGSLVSTKVNGVSHWFNRVSLNLKEESLWDVDLTGDQFPDRKGVEMAPAGQLWPETRIRSEADVNVETRARAWLLAKRAGVIRE